MRFYTTSCYILAASGTEIYVHMETDSLKDSEEACSIRVELPGKISWYSCTRDNNKYTTAEKMVNTYSSLLLLFIAVPNTFEEALNILEEARVDNQNKN